MFENIGTFFKRIIKTEPKQLTSKDAAKERLHLVLMQDRANVSADFLELMKQEIIDVIKKYIEIDEKSIDVRLTNQENSDGTNGAPALYANIPIINIKNDMKVEKMNENSKKDEEKADDEIKENNTLKIDEEKKSNEEDDKTIVFEEKVEDKEEEKTEDTSIDEYVEEKEIEIEKEEQTELKEKDEIDDVPTFDELLKQSEEESTINEDLNNQKKDKNNKNKSKSKKKK